MKAREPGKGRPKRNRDKKPMDSEQLFQYLSGGQMMGNWDGGIPSVAWGNAMKRIKTMGFHWIS